MNNNQEVKSPFSKLVQVGVVVKDMDKTIEQLTALGMGPFETRAIPPDAEEWFGNKRMNAFQTQNGICV